jgi:hypothetical protein
MYATTEKGKHRRLLCKALKRFYDLTDLQEWVWEGCTHKAFEETINTLLRHYAWLARDAMDKGLLQYSTVLKHHMLVHFGAQSKYLSPRACWCYGPESFMSVTKTVAVACARSTPSYQLPEKVLQKFSLSFELLLKGWLQIDREDLEEQ